MTRKRLLPILCLLALTGGWPGAALPPSPRLRQSIQIDLDRDGRVERLELDARQSAALAVWRGSRRLWQGIPGRWRPWKLMTADVDGDGRREIVVGLYKSTRFFPTPHRCLFVYSFDGRTVRPRWLGSSLSQPFLDFTFADLDRDRAQELVSVEIRRDGRRCMTVYSWNGFGFTADRQRGAWRTARLLRTADRRVLLQADGRKIAIGAWVSRD